MRIAVVCQSVFGCPFLLCLFTLSSLMQARSIAEEQHVVHAFDRQQLTDVYFSEGANAGDINGDSIPDIVYGPYWFAGPDYTAKHEIYPPVPQDRNRYADNFFNWVMDFNGDGLDDVLVVGFPGTPAYVYENPGEAGFSKHWPKHQVFDWVSNESPQLVDIVGDERPELLCTRDGFFGFVTIPDDHPLGPWEFHPISEQITATKFGHGLGAGDVDGDGLIDIIHSKGWFQQPASDALTSRWKHHEVSFSMAGGGAEMYAYDVDGDGLNDIITSHAAHDFGLGWYQQYREGNEIKFKHHLIMGSHPSENKYGVLFSELHSVNLVDIDGDGLKDIVTGKTYWSHHQKSPMWDAGAVVYWFKLVRSDTGIDWIPYLVDDQAGIGRQLTVTDVNGDGLPDIVVGGMKGAHVLTHRIEQVTEAEWLAAQPKVYTGEQLPVVGKADTRRGPKPTRDQATNLVDGAIEGEMLSGTATSGQIRSQDMSRFRGDRWSGDGQLWWTGAKLGDKLTLPLPPFTGMVDVELVLTRAKNYGVVQLWLDDHPLGDPIDLYATDVTTTGVFSFPRIAVKGNQHALRVQMVGANPKAVKSYMFALDFVRIRQANGEYVAGPTKKGNSGLVVAAGNQPRRAPAPTTDPGFAPKRADGRVLNFDFETGTLDDWTATGNAFIDQPIQGDTVATRRPGMPSAHEGEFWIGGYERIGDRGTGTLTSTAFVVSAPYASFLSNGGDTDQTRIELVRKDTGDVFYKISGTNSETMRQVVVDMRAHLGKEVMIRIVDEHQGGWGHVNFDHFRLHDVRPGPVTPPTIALVADEYPHAGLEADQAAAVMQLPDGFHVTVGAAEPAVRQPIAMALDDRGRVWIAEAYEYPIRADGDQGRDRILVFEDTTGDGQLDQRTVFFEGLNLVSGLEVGFGGVWVGAAPYLMFIPDHDGDDVPDGDPQILLDGWGYQDTHETLNAFIWGPDGWLYGCHGVFTHSRVGKPGTPDEDRIPLNAAVWRYHPTKHQFEVFSHGTSNPWGVDFNDHGQAFITACVIPHLYHMVQGGRYQRQGGQHFNPHTYRDIVTIADHLHYLGATPHSGNSKSDAAGGGHAHAGAMIYLGDAWPQRYRNQIFMNNIHGQRLNVDILKPSGSGYVGSHAPDFLLTGDQASQILNLRYGPDGNTWMIDWYDMQACHRRDPELHDRTNGRIYKIIYGEPGRLTESVDLSNASDLELAKLTLHANDWYVRHSRRLLQQRAVDRPIDARAIERLVQILSRHDDDTRRLRAAWALHVVDALNEELRQRLLADQSPYVRGWGIQMSMEASGDLPSEALLQQFVELSRSDESPVVRLYLASAAQRIPLPQRWSLLESLTRHAADANDHNLPLMYWYAAEPLADLDASRALALALQAGESIPLLRQFMLRRIGSSDAGSSLAVLVQGLGQAADPSLRVTFLQAIRAALRGQRQVAAPPQWAHVSSQLLRSDDPQTRLQATALGVIFGDPAALESMRAQVVDPASDDDAKLLALQSLLDANDPGLASTLISLLSAVGPLREAAIQGLAQYESPEVADALLDHYLQLTPEQKQMALGTLCSRSTSGQSLLRAIEEQRVPATDLTADLVRQLQFLKSAEITSLLNRVWGTARESAADKLAMIEHYKSLVVSSSHPEPDLALGRAVFAKTCMKCHVLYGVGYKIGPDLTGSNRSNLEYLLSNIVDPSAVMAKEYLPTIVLTTDGRVVSGLVQAEDKNSITIQTSDALVIVPQDEIEQRQESDKSMMPDDQLKQFSDHEVRSLIAYLRGKEQSPILATPENASSFFSSRDLSHWSGHDGLWSVENGELVGRTAGLQRNEWLVSDFLVGDFRLSLEVKLVDNAGNSGIQFRSEAHDGTVSGYQADIGKGWWGKLYEEHGRKLLWKESGEEHVRVGDWNQYEVIAKGHRIRTFINGNLCVDLHDPEGALRGIIALQLHSGGATEVRFRKLQLEVLESDPLP